MISIVLRALLVIVSVWLFCHVLRSVRKSQVQIDDIIFWLLFSVIMIVLALVPQIASWAANLLGVMSPVNLIYLVIIFVLLLKLFSISIRFSQLEAKIKTLTQEIAVRESIEKDPQFRQTEMRDDKVKDNKR